MAPTASGEQASTLLSSYDLHLFNEGKHNRLFEKFGARSLPWIRIWPLLMCERSLSTWTQPVLHARQWWIPDDLL